MIESFRIHILNGEGSNRYYYNIYILEIQPEPMTRIVFKEPQGQGLYRAGGGKPVPPPPGALGHAGAVSCVGG